MVSLVAMRAKAMVLLGLLLVVGMGTSIADVLSLHLGVRIEPARPKVNEVSELVVKVWEGMYAEVSELEVSFESSQGIQLAEGSSKVTLALRGREAKECRFKVKYVSSPADFTVKARYRKVKVAGGKIYEFQENPRDPNWGIASGFGVRLFLYEKDERFYTGTDLKRLQHPDPAIVLQQELGLPDVGSEKSIWSSVAFHLNKDIDEYSKIKKVTREAVINLLKNKSETLEKERKISREQAYDVILRERLLWKDAGIADPFDYKNRKLYPDIWKGMEG